jgi:DNA-binding transcriptional LysR family regulator
MEIYQLRTFVMVTRHASITQAANTLHVTQSTVSGHIKALEGELGVTLFVRTTAGVELTSFGQQMLSKAQQILAISDELLADARDQVGKLSGHIRLAVINDAETLGLGEIMTDMRERYPDTTVLIRHGLSGWAFNEVKNGQCDAGFFIGQITDPEIRAIPIREIRYCIVGPIAWREKVESAGWSAIGKLPWLWVPPLGSYPRLVTELLARHGVTPNKVVETDREATTQSLVSAGVGLCLLREERARAAVPEGKIFVWEEGITSADLSFIYPASRENDPLIQALLAVVTENRPLP